MCAAAGLTRESSALCARRRARAKADPMSGEPDAVILEERQHDAVERLAYRFELQRREFFKLMGGGVVVCLCAPALAQESGGRARPNAEDELPKGIDAWLHIAEDGAVT